MFLNQKQVEDLTGTFKPPLFPLWIPLLDSPRAASINFLQQLLSSLLSKAPNDQKLCLALGFQVMVRKAQPQQQGAAVHIASVEGRVLDAQLACFSVFSPGPQPRQWFHSQVGTPPGEAIRQTMVPRPPSFRINHSFFHTGVWSDQPKGILA